MGDFISQEEIDALLNGVSSVDKEEEITNSEIDILGEVGNISSGTSATTLSQILGRKVTITTPQVSIVELEEMKNTYLGPYVGVIVEYSAGLKGNNLLVIPEEDVKKITDIMMGGDGTNVQEEITELHLSAISEAMNQMIGSSAASMAQMLHSKIDIMPPKVSQLKLESGPDFLSDFDEYKKLAKVAFLLNVEDLLETELSQLIPIAFVKDMVKKFLAATQPEAPKEKPQEKPQPKKAPPEDIPQAHGGFDTVNVGVGSQGQPPQNLSGGQANMPPQNFEQPMYPNMGYPPMGYPQGAPGMGGYPYPPAMPIYYGPGPGGDPKGPGNVNVQPASFQPFEDSRVVFDKKNVDIIMDVPLQVTVELGRTNRLIKDILEFGAGTIIELDKLAGEPVDILVNGKHVAKGEVVVIDESFGVRITEIVQPSQRI